MSWFSLDTLDDLANTAQKAADTYERVRNVGRNKRMPDVGRNKRMPDGNMPIQLTQAPASATHSTSPTWSKWLPVLVAGGIIALIWLRRDK